MQPTRKQPRAAERRSLIWLTEQPDKPEISLKRSLTSWRHNDDNARGSRISAGGSRMWPQGPPMRYQTIGGAWHRTILIGRLRVDVVTLTHHPAERPSLSAFVARLEEEPHANPNTRTREFSLRDPDGYYVTISELSSLELTGHTATVARAGAH